MIYLKMGKELSQAEIEKRLAERARKIQKEVEQLERAGIKSQKTGQLAFNTPGQHGVVYTGGKV
jgi:hypothetical protein